MLISITDNLKLLCTVLENHSVGQTLNFGDAELHAKFMTVICLTTPPLPMHTIKVEKSDTRRTSTDKFHLF